ncbi:spermine/spermidine synthase domain-containing protein, partial [Salinispira pacifica]
IGGGDGGILREVLKHPSVSQVDFVELDREVVEFSRRYLPDISAGAFDDPRVTIHISDGRAFVEAQDRRYDAVIMDMTDPEGPSEMLYTREFFSAVERCLKDERALFTMHSESPVVRPVAYQVIRKTLAQVFEQVHGAYAFVQMYATLWSIAIASRSTNPAALSPEEVDRRIADRGLSPLHLIDGASWHAMLTAPPYIASLRGGDVPVITDAAHRFPDNFAR